MSLGWTWGFINCSIQFKTCFQALISLFSMKIVWLLEFSWLSLHVFGTCLLFHPLHYYRLSVSNLVLTVLSSDIWYSLVILESKALQNNAFLKPDLAKHNEMDSDRTTVEHNLVLTVWSTDRGCYLVMLESKALQHKKRTSSVSWPHCENQIVFYWPSPT